MDKRIDDMLKETFIEQFEEYLVQLDDNSAVFGFESGDNPLILNKPLKDFLDVLDMVFSDYQITIARTSEHVTVQVLMRLEEGLWKPK